MKTVNHKTNGQVKYGRNIFTWGVFFLTLFCHLFSTYAFAQQVSGTYTVSSPEAGLFFLNPNYLNPARGMGVMGLQNNPAALASVTGREFALAASLPQSSSGSFAVQATQPTEIYDAFYLDTKVQLKECGGLAGIGYAQQVGAWHLGAMISQPRKANLSLRIQGSASINSHFQLDKSITREMVPDLPAEEIPMQWQVDTSLLLRLSGTPAEIDVGILPINIGVGYKAKILSVGLGLTYFHIYSNNEPASYSTSLTGTSHIIGTPYGNDPLTGQPWKGSIDADCYINDQPLKGYYNLEVSGSRMALSCGGIINFKILSLGAAYSYGFRGHVNGRYDLRTIYTTGMPDISTLSNADIDWSLHPDLKGTVKLNLSDFQKDSLSYHDEGKLGLEGYHAYSVGVHFLALGLFVAGEVPTSPPDLGSLTVGTYLDIPIPYTSARFNLGFIQRSDGVWGQGKTFVPFRILAHVGTGIAFKVPYYKLIHLGQDSGWFMLGLRSSLTSTALNLFQDKTSNTKAESLPSLTKNVALSCGIQLPL
jgi:hypothetical protein